MMVMRRSSGSRQRYPRKYGREARAQRGFSLLEALVAMVIATMALATLYRTVGQSSKNAVDVEARVEAALVARSVLAAATYAEDLPREPAGQAGVWHWSLRVAPEKVALREADGRSATAVLSAAQVTVRVAREKDGPAVLTWTTWKPYRSVP